MILYLKKLFVDPMVYNQFGLVLAHGISDIQGWQFVCGPIISMIGGSTRREHLPHLISLKNSVY